MFANKNKYKKKEFKLLYFFSNQAIKGIKNGKGIILWRKKIYMGTIHQLSMCHWSINTNTFNWFKAKKKNHLRRTEDKTVVNRFYLFIFIKLSLSNNFPNMVKKFSLCYRTYIELLVICFPSWSSCFPEAFTSDLLSIMFRQKLQTRVKIIVIYFVSW